jgi:uncharacterized protein (TIGR02588 family)
MNIPRKNWVEWAVFGAGAVIVLLVVGFLSYDMLMSGDAPAILMVELGTPVRAGDHYMVPVTVENRGDTSAENVSVEVTHTGEGEPVRSVVELAFVPRGSTGSGWVVFLTEPAPGALKARVLGFAEP